MKKERNVLFCSKIKWYPWPHIACEHNFSMNWKFFFFCFSFDLFMLFKCKVIVHQSVKICLKKIRTKMFSGTGLYMTRFHQMHFIPGFSLSSSWCGANNSKKNYLLVSSIAIFIGINMEWSKQYFFFLRCSCCVNSIHHTHQ